MSITYTVFLREDAIPARNTWQHALEDKNIPLLLPAALDVRSSRGYVPCTFDGKKSGFELHYSAPGSFTPDESIEIPDFQDLSLIEFVAKSSDNESLCAECAALILTNLAHGVYTDDHGHIVDGHGAVNQQVILEFATGADLPIPDDPASVLVLDLEDKGITRLPGFVLDCTNLEELSLNKNPGIQLPEDLSSLKKLRRLSLIRCGLTAVPEGVFTLSGLEVLYLGYNPLKDLSAAIGRLPCLRDLSLADCSLRELPEEIGDLDELETLGLEWNGLTRLPESIGRLRKLRQLDLRMNSISELPGSIRQLENLQRLNLAGRQVSAEYAKQLKKLLPNATVTG